MLATTSRRRPLGRTIVHVALALSVAFGTLAAAGGYWAVIKAPELVRSPLDPAVIQAARTVPRGSILDRDGEVLARNEKDANGELYRVYRGESISQVVGYASSRYGRAGLELAYDAELSGLAGDPVSDALRKFGTDPYDPKDLTLSLSLELQRAAVRALGDRKGAVVMLDPRNGEVLAMASTPTYSASALADPATADRTFKALQEDEDEPLLPRATLGRYVPGSVFKIVTAIAGLGSGAVTPRTTYAEQPGAEEDGLRGRWVPDPRRPSPLHGLRAAGPRRRDPGLLQHLVRAHGSRDRWRRPRRLRRAPGLRGAAALRPADRDLAGHERERRRPGRLRRRRRAGERRLRPGRDVRDAPPDGAGGEHRRERRGAAPSPARDGHHGRARDADDRRRTPSGG